MSTVTQGVPAKNYTMMVTEMGASGDPIDRTIVGADNRAELVDYANGQGLSLTPADIVTDDLSEFYRSTEEVRTKTLWVTRDVAVIHYRREGDQNGYTVFRILED